MLAQTIIESFLSLYQSPSYLEVGVFKGESFLPLKTRRKVAVDPNFLFDVDAARAAQPEAEFHPVGSDVYFGQIIRPDERFDVIFLDGLHTFEQTLRDFANAVQFIKPEGVIVIDDVYPSSWAASLPDLKLSRRAKEELTGYADGGSWMGDVYRLVYFIESFWQQFSFRTVVEGHGRLVIWREPRRSVPPRRVEDVGRLPYEAVMLEKASFNFKPLAEIRSEVESSIRSRQR